MATGAAFDSFSNGRIRCLFQILDPQLSVITQGAAVAVNDLVADRAAATKATITDAGGRALAVAFDVTDYESVLSGVRRVESELGPIDVLVNNAGIPDPMPLVLFRDTEPADWSRLIDINLYGVLHCCRAVIDGMCDRGFGRVITISSGAGTSGVGIGVSAYGAGKGGAVGFMRNLALDVARKGVTVNSLALGLMNNVADSHFKQRFKHRRFLAFGGSSHVEWFEGNYQDYEVDRKKRLGADADTPHRIKYRRIDA